MSNKEQIILKAFEIIEARPEGIRLKQLIIEIKAAFPEMKENTIRGSVWDLDKTLVGSVYKVGAGIFRSTKFGSSNIEGIILPKNGKSSKQKATEFENQIKSLLEHMEFNDIDGARDDFLVNGVQVDVCGGWGNALLVIECKRKEELGEKNLRAAISEFRGKIPVLEDGFKNHKYNSKWDYSKYSFFKYIMVTQNIEVRKEDIAYANTRPSIYLWNDDFLAYYNDLYSFIKPYSKFSLLGEMLLLFLLLIVLV